MYKYTPIAVVGEGTYGTVAKCRDTSTGKLVAVKRLKNALSGRHCEMIVREIRLLRMLADDHVVTMIEVFRYGDFVYMVFPLLWCNLYQYMVLRGGGLAVDDAKRCVYQILKGLDYVHNRNIVHRDIKPENILLTEDGIIKICDFGVSRMFCLDNLLNLSVGVGTLWYQAPEVLMGLKNYDSTVDVWSVGVLITELIDHWPVVAEETSVNQVHGIAELLRDVRSADLRVVAGYLRERGIVLTAASRPAGHGSYAIVDTVQALRRVYAEWPARLLHTVACCLQLDPARRKNAAQLLRMEFFTAGSFSRRYDRELRAVLRRRRRDDSDDGGGGGGGVSTRKKRLKTTPPALLLGNSNEKNVFKN